MRLFVKNDCDFCNQLVIPEGINNFEKINIDEDYGGFVPPQVPVLQIEGLNLEGPHVINVILKAIDDNKR